MRVIKANNSRQIPEKEWGSTIWLLRSNYYSYDQEKDSWLLIPKGSQEYQLAVDAWDQQRNNATPIKTTVQEGT